MQMFLVQFLVPSDNAPCTTTAWNWALQVALVGVSKAHTIWGEIRQVFWKLNLMSTKQTLNETVMWYAYKYNRQVLQTEWGAGTGHANRPDLKTPHSKQKTN